MKCPSCGRVSHQNTDECVYCGAGAPTATGGERAPAGKPPKKNQLDFSFPIEEEPETAVETQATLSSRTLTALSTKPAATLAGEIADEVTEEGSEDSSYGSGTHWQEDEPATAGNTWVEMYRLASGFGRRAAAMLFDGAIFLGIFTVLIFVLETGTGEFSLTNSAFVPAYVFLLVLHGFYFTFFHAVLGQTPGKMLAKIRVVSVHDGLLLSPWDSFMRWIGYFLSALPAGLGFLWSILDNDDRALHDRWAKSVVVLVDSQVAKS